MSDLGPVPNVHEPDCSDPTCLGCFSADVDGPASDDLRETVTTMQASNARRLAAVTAQLGQPPNLTLGLIDKLADATLGAGTARRFLFTLTWETSVAEWLDATEAEIRKARIAAAENAGKLAAPKPNGLHSL